ncbi:hypothetical protein A2U01_0066464, partial [Trifolium medium]|nr:hypothetical protein [Trifolium medium]
EQEEVNELGDLKLKFFLIKPRSGTCVSCRGIWRVAPFIQKAQEFSLPVARCAK